MRWLAWHEDAFDHGLLWDEPFAYVEDDHYAERYVAGAQDIVWIGHEDWAKDRPKPVVEKPAAPRRTPRGWALRWAREVMLQRGETIPARIEYNVAPSPPKGRRDEVVRSIDWPTFAQYDGYAIDGYHDFVGRWQRFGKQMMDMRVETSWVCAVANRPDAIFFLRDQNRWPFAIVRPLW